MPVDPAGLVIGLGAILLAFKGLVDTLNLFEDIAARDNGQRHLALKYYIERHRWRIWGDEMRAEDHLASPLLGLPRTSRMLVAGILAELCASHELAQHYVKKYDMTSPDTVGNPVMDDGFKIKGKLMSMMKKDRSEKAQKHRFSWTARDKERFGEILQRMESLTNDLYEVVPSDNSQALAGALSSYLLPKLKDTLTLAVLQQVDVPKDPLLLLSARLKVLNDSPQSEMSQQVVRLDFEKVFTADTVQPDLQRQFGHLELQGDFSNRVWIEWKVISPKLSPDDAQTVRSRIEALSVLLMNAKAREFRIPLALGLVEDEKYRQNTQGKASRLGVVYAWPAEIDAGSIYPRSLQDLMDPDNPPLLSVRFSLAYKLASALSLLHASRWLHKSFRPDNILFFPDTINRPKSISSFVLDEPYITGFEYSRPESQASLEQSMTGKPELDLFYHPDVNLHGFTKVRDLYSLGVLLIEIALWTPISLRVTIDEAGKLEDMSSLQMRSYILDLSDELGAVVGPLYRDAVRTCLTGDFHLLTNDEGTELARAVFTQVLKKLSSCRA